MVDNDGSPPPSDEEPKQPPTAPLVREPADDDEENGEHRQVPKPLLEMMAMFSQVGPAPFPLADKLTAEHISTMLEIDRARVGNDRESEREERHTHLIGFGIFCVFVLALVGLLLAFASDELTENILIGLVTLVAGFAGGYGVGRSRAQG